jgi:Domain of unknown function (DUF4349)
MKPFARAARPGELASGTSRSAMIPSAPTGSRWRAMLLVAAVCSGSGMLVAACSATAQSGSATNGAHSAAGAGTPAFGTSNAGVQGAAPDAAPSAGGRVAARAQLALSTQSIIYTAYLTLRVKDVTGTATTATSIVTAVGGYVSDEQESLPRQNHATPIVTLTYKIPVAAYHATMAKLGALGRQVSVGQHAQDVTQQVADVSSRVGSAQAAIKQLRTLLSKAGSVGQLLQVQDEINAQESSLEALLAQQRALAHETSFATATVTLVGPHVVIVKKHEKKKSHGFGTGLRAGWHALVLVVSWVLTALGAALPFLIPVALIAAIGLEGRRRLTRRRRSPATDPPATAQP